MPPTSRAGSGTLANTHSQSARGTRATHWTAAAQVPTTCREHRPARPGQRPEHPDAQTVAARGPARWRLKATCTPFICSVNRVLTPPPPQQSPVPGRPGEAGGRARPRTEAGAPSCSLSLGRESGSEIESKYFTRRFSSDLIWRNIPV